MKITVAVDVRTPEGVESHVFKIARFAGERQNSTVCMIDGEEVGTETFRCAMALCKLGKVVVDHDPEIIAVDG